MVMLWPLFSGDAVCASVYLRMCINWRVSPLLKASDGQRDFTPQNGLKGGSAAKECEMVSKCIPVICLPASGAFSVLLPWQQWLAVCVCVVCVVCAALV